MLTGDMLRRSAARFPDRPAIVFRGADRRTVVFGVARSGCVFVINCSKPIVSAMSPPATTL